MRISRVFLAALAVNLMLSANSSGQVKKGLTELNVTGTVNAASAEGQTFTTAEISTALGRFVGKNLEVGFNWHPRLSDMCLRDNQASHLTDM